MRTKRLQGRRGWWRVAAAAILAAGCRGGAPPVAPPPDVRLVDHAELMAAVAAHRGKVVVLDCWSTACPPCVKEFPGLVAIAARHPEVACLSLSFDYEGIGTPADALPQVRQFLAAVGAGRIENLLGREEADAMYRQLELASVPAVYVWRPDGSLARRFDDDDAAKRLGRPFTYADVEATVLEALGR